MNTTQAYSCPQISAARPEFPKKRLRQLLANIKIDTTECWLWLGALDERGYGRTSFRNKSIPAHRLVYIAFVNDIPADSHIHHECRVKMCVNPSHLRCVAASEHNLQHVKYTTHCAKGHELTPENTYLFPGGQKRRCRICANERACAQRAKLAATRSPRTECRNGHALTSENVYLHKGIRFCRACHAANTAKHYAKLRTRTERPADAPTHPSKWTHCKNGHEFTAENTLTVNGRRRCKVCHVKYYTEYWAKKRLAATGKPLEVRGDARTHCRRGHELTHENVYLDPAGRKICKTCRTQVRAELKQARTQTA